MIRVERYTPYGEPSDLVLDAGPGFTGHATDVLTGLTNMQQRYFDAEIGRFLTPDPISTDPNTGGNFNVYWYADNNPVSYTDPDGRAPQGCGDGTCPSADIRAQEAVEISAMFATSFPSIADSFAEGSDSSGSIMSIFIKPLSRQLFTSAVKYDFAAAKGYIQTTTKNMAATSGKSGVRTLQSFGDGGEKGAQKLFDKLTNGKSEPTKLGGSLGRLADGSSVQISTTEKNGITVTSVRITSEKTGTRIKNIIKVRFKE